MSDEARYEVVHLEGLLPEQAAEEILHRAVDLGASDVFFSADVETVSIDLRHLGIVRKLQRVPKAFGERVIRHFKAEAGLDITETRRPQDGRWIYQSPRAGTIDLRLSSLPTLYGEDMSVRLLHRETQLRGINALGLLRQQHNALVAMLSSPSGLVLVTGPTGSGKTTSLYAFLQQLHNGQRKINTIEDPVEYAFEGLHQSQVNTRLGVDFPELLRGVLRQGPDVIMIGEIRDRVTAETAVRAANSGHLVFSTVHAPVAAGAVQSMLNLGVNPYFLASALIGVVAQRLVRTLCKECRSWVDLSTAPHTFEEIKPWMKNTEGDHMYAATGCDACHSSGYSARTGVFEVLPVNAEIRQLIASSSTARDIHRAAADDGMLEFRRTALLQVAQGNTTIEEVFRAVPVEYMEEE